MPKNADKLFILTGGPGAGKTSLIAAAAEHGLRTTPEAGRAIIQSQLAIGGAALPWTDPALYAELMLDRDMQVYEVALASGETCLCDRGVPDLVGYARLMGLDRSEHFRRAAEIMRYNSTVFIAPPWRAIYAQDTERKQDWAEAVRTYETLADSYVSLGYHLVELPSADIATRLDFVLDRIGHG